MDIQKSVNKRSLGSLGEDAAAEYLASTGFTMLSRNYRCGKMGEIDIIASEREYICFIEVKTRTGTLFGAPCEAVDRKKQVNIRNLAWTYLKFNCLTDRNLRFDIVEVICIKKENVFEVKNINLIRNAF